MKVTSSITLEKQIEATFASILLLGYKTVVSPTVHLFGLTLDDSLNFGKHITKMNKWDAVNRYSL